FICSVAMVGGMLQVHRHFLAPASAPVFLNIVIIAGVIFFSGKFQSSGRFDDVRWDQIYSAAWAVLIAGVIQFAIQLPALRKYNISLTPRFAFNEEPLKKIFKIMLPMIIGLAAVQINTLMDTVIAYVLRATPETGETLTLFGRTIYYPVIEGSVTYLFYAQRCYQFPLGVFGIALATAIFPFLSSCVVNNDMKGFGRQLNHGIRLVLFIGIPASVGLIIVATPMVRAIFEGDQFTVKDTSNTAITLVYYSLGVTAYCLQQLIVRAYYSFKDSVTPMKIAIRMIALNFLLNVILIWPLATGGLGLATTISATLQAVILLRIIVKRYKLEISGRIIPCILKSIISSGIMALVGIVLLKFTQPLDKYSQILILTFGCIAVYYFVTKLLKAEELSMLSSKK
ncbi:MAG: murein biosynthesis integral membrane protein MurJ, partial [Proteobacteria bacterium]|nr:murein biosynthesis integral membrane protein MurJ [Pseudomonadota bacterium]